MSRSISLFVFFCLSLSPQSRAASNDSELVQSYRATTDQIIQAALVDKEAYRKLTFLCDQIGHRLSGSSALERAISWAAETMRRDGLTNIRTLPVRVPKWIRGEEYARVTSPVERPLHMLGLGGSVSTPPGGIVAPVTAVRSFDELAALDPSQVAGRIVLFNAPFQGYGTTVRYRTRGAVEAAKLGAIAVLVRSVTPRSLQSPHTGGLRYSNGVSPIPAAAVSVEDALMLQRFAERGQRPVVELFMEGQTAPDAESANVIAELPGKKKAQEVVLLGAHIDSWDVGQGAHDDGAGVVVCMQAAALLKSLGLKPDRTIRVVLFTNEENGLAGGRAYREWVGEKISRHVAAIEMDGGAEKPVGFGLGLSAGLSRRTREAALARLRSIGSLLNSIGAGRITRGGGGADIGPLMKDGVPGLGVRTVGEHYFDWHHTAADTLDKVDPAELSANLAAVAVMAYVLADMEPRLISF